MFIYGRLINCECVTISWHLVLMLRSPNFVRLKSASVCLDLTRPWLKEGLFCSAEPQDPEPLRSSIAARRRRHIVKIDR